VHPCYLAYREQVLRESGAIGDGSPSPSPLPRSLQPVRRGPVALPMFRSLDLRVDVVVAEIPVLVRADDLTAARAEDMLAALDATCKLGTPATVRRPVHRSLASVLYQPPAFALSFHHRRRFRRLSAIGVDHALSLLIGEKRGGEWVERRAAALKTGVG